MATNLERKRIQVELSKVAAARQELEMKVMEREEDIARIREHIKIQELKENELQAKLDKMAEES